MEELVQQLGRRQAEQKKEEAARDADRTIISLREAVADAKDGTKERVTPLTIL